MRRQIKILRMFYQALAPIGSPKSPWGMSRIGEGWKAGWVSAAPKKNRLVKKLTSPNLLVITRLYILSADILFLKMIIARVKSPRA